MASKAERAMRAVIETRLARPRPSPDPRSRLLADIEGPVSQAMLERLARPRTAAVLLGLIERPGALTVLFTERAPHLKDHPGQISFPGGRLEEREGIVAAALREADEEIGLKPEHVSVAGCLDAYLTGTGFTVTPVVGFVDQRFEPVPDPTEVAAVFEAPLQFFLHHGNLRAGRRTRLGTTFRAYEFHYQGHVIWGATAAMLINFRDLLSDEKTK